MSNAPGCPRTRFLKGGGYPTPPRESSNSIIFMGHAPQLRSHAKPTLTN